ncbi:lectin-like protein [Humisphaera borealis]|uniref:C-type lectin domain-containing protein n=1 Tax=Humisphaera borealis TaxID=2807512 RepID=A0A7M2X2S0_9BACT|nr:lectin-like protein [Humisphaera borealis]QOV91974.1 hypothetical protein IPV69_11710 [Humisphaera borealis]
MAVAGGAVPTRAGVLLDYGTLGGNTYVAVRDPSLSWSEAAAAIAPFGGHLVTITSAAEQAFVEQLLQSGNSQGGAYWIGLQKSSGTYNWITGEPVSYTNWLPGQPDNNQGAETVGSILWSIPGEHPAGTPGEWNDLPDPYHSAFSTYVDLNNGGFIAEYSGIHSVGANGAPGGAPPASVPIPPAVVIGSLGLILAGRSCRRARGA